jgi:hypothetical protein
LTGKQKGELEAEEALDSPFLFYIRFLRRFVMQSKSKKSVIERTYQESGSLNKELRDNDRLSKFFEILMQIDQRQKRNGKSN